ncbi:hypothetical protein FHR87_002816 [Azomonas macrocytogenes]|uniref:Uncharacterized protein n=1 Tax=Azomonas macrocytogenes TaxID=69962 RepID=A0A839T6D2_AZOMA|nr:hypothetical protein [Azomonas macrocytogenes]
MEASHHDKLCCGNTCRMRLLRLKKSLNFNLEQTVNFIREMDYIPFNNKENKNKELSCP